MYGVELLEIFNWPYFLPGRLNGYTYRQFLEHSLPDLLDDDLILTRHCMWFMHDGAPAHFSFQAREFLNHNYNNRWTGRGGTQPWPPRSPDLNSLDFFLWGHLKTLVYNTPINSEEELRTRIIVGCETIRNTPGGFFKGYETQ